MPVTAADRETAERSYDARFPDAHHSELPSVIIDAIAAALAEQRAAFTSPCERLIAVIRQRAAELCPDYPNVTDADEFDCLWAITSALEGTLLANGDLHKMLAEQRERLVAAHRDDLVELDAALREPVSDSSRVNRAYSIVRNRHEKLMRRIAELKGE